MNARLWKSLVAFAATAVCVIGIATPSSQADTNQIVTGPWGGPTAQGQRIDFTVNAGVPMTVDPISFGAVLNCPTRPDFSVGHGFFGFQTPIDGNNQFLLEFGPDQGSTLHLQQGAGHVHVGHDRGGQARREVGRAREQDPGRALQQRDGHLGRDSRRVRARRVRPVRPLLRAHQGSGRQGHHHTGQVASQAAFGSRTGPGWSRGPSFCLGLQVDETLAERAA